jgi:hypothetical protein
MFGIGKQKVALTEAVTALLQVARGSDSDKHRAAEEQFVHPLRATGVDECALRYQLQTLRIFAIGYAVRSCGASSLADEYETQLHDLFVRAGEPVAWRELESDLNRYKEAAETPHHKGPAWQVGKVFAELCGGDSLDIRLVGAGSMAFAACMKIVSQFLKEVKIVGAQ